MAAKTVFTVDHSCGHSEDVDLSSRPAAKRPGLAAWMATKPCGRCRGVSDEWKAQQEAERAAFTERAEMPELAGTEKQRAWAFSIRADMLRAAYDEFIGSQDWSEDDFEKRILDPARIIVAAKFWIETKDTDLADLEEVLVSAREVEGWTCENVL